MHARRAPLLLTLLAALAVAFSPASARAQSDLEQENAELRAKVEKLQKDLVVASDRIKALNEELDQLRRQLGTSGRKSGKSGGAPSSEPVAAPKSSPSAILAALKASYQEKLGALPTESRADQIRFQREAAAWTGEAEKENSGDAEWHIRLTDAPNMTSRGTTLKFDLLDTPGGQVVEKGLELSVNSRLGRSISLDSAQKDWTLTGTMRVQPRVDMKRADEASGSPGDPPLVGPFVEFRYEFVATDAKKSEPEKK